MNYVKTFLSKHGTHRNASTFSPMHVTTQCQGFMCMRCHSGEIQQKMKCPSVINVGGQHSKLLDVKLLNSISANKRSTSPSLLPKIPCVHKR